MQITPLIAVHATAALLALGLGPFAIWARKGALQRPKLHRAFGYGWVTLMVVAATSAIFISDPVVPNIAGFSPIHILIPVVFFSLYKAFRHLALGNIKAHRYYMTSLYIGACVGAGVFTLLPNRVFGKLVWGSLGLA